MEDMLEVIEYNGEGYRAVMKYGEWRVAFLNYADRFDEANQNYLEAHLKTDEVFVLLEGTATLIIGKDFKPVEMEKNKIYNVKAGAWHNIRVSKDAKVLIVENLDTSKENSEYYYYK